MQSLNSLQPICTIVSLQLVTTTGNCLIVCKTPPTKLSSNTHQSHSLLSPPPLPPLVDSPLRPHHLGLYFKELVTYWFICNTTTPSDPLYVHLTITPPGSSQTLHTPSPHPGINPPIMAMVPPPPVPLPHQCSANTPQFDPHNHFTLKVYLGDYELADEAAHLTAAD